MTHFTVKRELKIALKSSMRTHHFQQCFKIAGKYSIFFLGRFVIVHVTGPIRCDSLVTSSLSVFGSECFVWIGHFGRTPRLEYALVGI